MQRLGIVYFAMMGGAAALETTRVEIEGGRLQTAQVPSACWKCRVEDFGPLIVEWSHGGWATRKVQDGSKSEAGGPLVRL